MFSQRLILKPGDILVIYSEYTVCTHVITNNTDQYVLFKVVIVI